MALCKKCKKQISFARVLGKFHPINPDGSPHDWAQCERDRNMRFIENGILRIETREFGNAYGAQKVTTEWRDLEGESLKISEGPFLTYAH